MVSLREKLYKGMKEVDNKIQSKAKEVVDKTKAGLDVGGAVIKTIGKRAIGDDSATELKPETKKTLGIED